MKSILISINPKWCEKIASREKTVEVRKTRPKLETPFKVYIYQTSKGHGENYLLYSKGLSCMAFNLERWRGKVIGEFVCDTFVIDRTFGHDALFRAAACMSDVEAAAYCTNNPMYGWHISDLVIYDKPRELIEFFRYCGDNPKCDGCEAHYYSNSENGLEDYCCSIIDGCKPLKRPPQSWCYVEEVHI